MPSGYIDDEELKVVKVFDRKLKSGTVSNVAAINVYVQSDNALAVDKALLLLKKRFPNRSISQLVCDAIIKSAPR